MNWFESMWLWIPVLLVAGAIWWAATHRSNVSNASKGVISLFEKKASQQPKGSGGHGGDNSDAKHGGSAGGLGNVLILILIGLLVYYVIVPWIRDFDRKNLDKMAPPSESVDVPAPSETVAVIPLARKPLKVPARSQGTSEYVIGQPGFQPRFCEAGDDLICLSDSEVLSEAPFELQCRDVQGTLKTWTERGYQIGCYVRAKGEKPLDLAYWYEPAS